MRLPICLMLLAILASPSYAQIFDLIKAGVDEVGKETRRLNVEIYEKTMIPKTIESVAYLKKNFDESKRFYDEMRLISERPTVLTDFTSGELVAMLKRSQAHAVSMAEMDYEMAYRKPGVIGRQQIVAEKYIRQNLKFADWARVQILGQEKIAEANAGKKPKDSAESAAMEAENSRLQTVTLLLLAKLTAQNLEATTKLYDLMSKQEREAVDRDDVWRAEIESLLRARMAQETKKGKTSGEALRELLTK